MFFISGNRIILETQSGLYRTLYIHSDEFICIKSSSFYVLALDKHHFHLLFSISNVSGQKSIQYIDTLNSKENNSEMCNIFDRRIFFVVNKINKNTQENFQKEYNMIIEESGYNEYEYLRSDNIFIKEKRISLLRYREKSKSESFLFEYLPEKQQMKKRLDFSYLFRFSDYEPYYNKEINEDIPATCVRSGQLLEYLIHDNKVYTIDNFNSIYIASMTNNFGSHKIYQHDILIKAFAKNDTNIFFIDSDSNLFIIKDNGKPILKMNIMENLYISNIVLNPNGSVLCELPLLENREKQLISRFGPYDSIRSKYENSIETEKMRNLRKIWYITLMDFHIKIMNTFVTIVYGSVIKNMHRMNVVFLFNMKSRKLSPVFLEAYDEGNDIYNVVLKRDKVIICTNRNVFEVELEWDIKNGAWEEILSRYNLMSLSLLSFTDIKELGDNYINIGFSSNKEYFYTQKNAIREVVKSISSYNDGISRSLTLTLTPPSQEDKYYDLLDYMHDFYLPFASYSKKYFSYMIMGNKAYDDITTEFNKDMIVDQFGGLDDYEYCKEQLRGFYKRINKSIKNQKYFITIPFDENLLELVYFNAIQATKYYLIYDSTGFFIVLQYNDKMKVAVVPERLSSYLTGYFNCLPYESDSESDDEEDIDDNGYYYEETYEEKDGTILLVL